MAFIIHDNGDDIVRLTMVLVIIVIAVKVMVILFFRKTRQQVMCHYLLTKKSAIPKSRMV